jgi:adenosylmethionine-8-amino-7-oxononanoate aminotransferase
VLDMNEPRLNWYDAGLRHLCEASDDTPLAAVLTHGCRIVLDDERELLDATSGGGAACHGFNHPHIGMAVARQLERMAHVPLDGLLHPEAAKLAHRLAGLLPGDLDRVVFAESGSAAVENALAFVLDYWTARGQPSRKRFLSFRNAWHGSTAAASALNDPAQRSSTRRLATQQFVAALPRDDEKAAALEALVARHANRLAGIVVEPLVQAQGGWHFHDAQVLRRLRALADKHGLLLIFDECTTGFGRTGAMFACINAGVMPDIVVLGKALAGGVLPLAATVIRREFYDAAPNFTAHSTFSGNAMACAAANASLDLFEQEPRLEQVAEIARQLEQGLSPCRDLPGVRDVRVMGAIGVVEFRRIAEPVVLRQRFVDAGIYMRPAGRAVALVPALTIEPYDLSVMTATTLKVLHEATRRRHRRKTSPDQPDLPL